MATETRSHRVDEALRRASVYELFAHAFAYPNDERIEALRAVAGEVLVTTRSPLLLRFATIAQDVGRPALEPAFVSLSTFSSSPDCPTFETAYFGSDAQQQTQRMADIAGFYRAFGVASPEGGYRPDDLPVELDFMAYLCRKEAFAAEHLGAPRVGQARRAQRMFLEEHLGRWAPQLGANVADHVPPAHFYGLAGETLVAWISSECRVLGAAPEPVSGNPIASWPAPVSHGPEFATGGSFIPIASWPAPVSHVPEFATGGSFIPIQELQQPVVR
jgi:TorA maturation chaperone TorD